VVAVRPDAQPEVVPTLVLLTEIDRAGPREHLAVLLGEALERPVRSAVLRADLAGLDREPDPRECEHRVARVVGEPGHHLVGAVQHGAGEILGRHGIDELGRRRPKQRPARLEHHREQERDVGIRGRRQRLDLAALERCAVPLAELEVKQRRVPPRFDVGLGHDRHFHGPRALARDCQQALSEPPLLLDCRRTPGEDEDVEVAPRPQLAREC